MQDEITEKFCTLENQIVTLKSLIDLLKSACDDTELDIASVLDLCEILSDKASEAFENLEEIQLKI